MTELSIVGPWARQKLELLRKYLHAYTVILKDQEWCDDYIYVDAFAGSGKYAIRKKLKEPPPPNLQPLFPDQGPEDELTEYIDGSPRVALSIEHPFTQYVFVELDPTRVARLKEIRREFPGKQVSIREADCNEYLRNRLINRSPNFWKSRRALVFLDPYGMQVPWATIEGLGNTRGVEILVNFPVGTIQRLLPRNARFTVEGRRKLNDYFGSEDWHDAVYTTQRGLFREVTLKENDSDRLLLQFYRDRLNTCFKYVSAAYLVKNSKGVHLYYLIHAGQNRIGSKIASDILGQGQVVRRRPSNSS